MNPADAILTTLALASAVTFLVWSTCHRRKKPGCGGGCRCKSA